MKGKNEEILFIMQEIFNLFSGFKVKREDKKERLAKLENIFKKKRITISYNTNTIIIQEKGTDVATYTLKLTESNEAVVDSPGKEML